MFVLQTLENKVARKPGNTEDYARIVRNLLDSIVELSGNETIYIQGVILRREALREGTIKVSPIPLKPNGAQLILRPGDFASGMLVILRVPHWMKVSEFIDALMVASKKIDPPKKKEVLALPKKKASKEKLSDPSNHHIIKEDSVTATRRQLEHAFLEKVFMQGNEALSRETVVDMLREVFQCEASKALSYLAPMRSFYEVNCKPGSYSAVSYEFDLEAIDGELQRAYS